MIRALMIVLAAVWVVIALISIALGAILAIDAIVHAREGGFQASFSWEWVPLGALMIAWGAHFLWSLRTSIGISQPDWTKARAVGTRLAFMVPLTPWPVFTWVQSQDEIPFGMHSADPLYAVRHEANMAAIATTALGLILIYGFCRDWAVRVIWLNFAAIHAYIIWQYLISNSGIYV